MRRLRVVPNGVDLEALDQAASQGTADLPGDGRSFRLGFFGRLTSVKRVDVIVELAALLKREVPGQFGVYLFGEGPLRSGLEQQVRRLGLEDVVHFMGFTSQPASWLRNMDALLLTSDHEGLPMIVLEAMALGVPVISHAVGAIPEVLGGGTLGTLVASQEPERYAEAVIALRKAPEVTRAQAARAAQEVASRYSVEHSVREYVAIYRELQSNIRHV
jgi:glycosyltransferase involved in cell wall biosynthesis